jgi:thioesterase domain-containing protein
MLPGTDFAVLRKDSSPAAPGEAGVLVVRGRAVALGAWTSGRLTPGSIMVDPVEPSARIYATGDMVILERDGLIRFVGRDDRQVKVNGARLDLGEMERHLFCDGVDDGAAVCSDDGDVVAFVAGAEDPIILEGRVRDNIRCKAPGRLQPKRLHVLSELPRLSSGKVDQRALLKLDRQSATFESDRVRRKPDADRPVLCAVVSAWRSFLPRSTGLERSWEAEGGDSLALLSMILQLERDLGVSLPPDRFTSQMTCKDFAREVEETFDVAEHPVRTGRPAVFFFPGMHGDIAPTARFRAALHRELPSVPLRYPALLDSDGRPPTLNVIADQLAQQICELQPTGALFLAGYSLGGAIAYEAAAHLCARDRTIAFLGILDTDLTLSDPVEWGLLSTPLIKTLAAAFESVLFRQPLKFALACAPVSVARRAALLLDVEAEMRLRALRRWLTTPKRPLLVPAALFFTDRARPRPSDLGWRRLLPSLELVRLGGDHVSCLDEDIGAEDNRRRFRDAFLAHSVAP